MGDAKTNNFDNDLERALIHAALDVIMKKYVRSDLVDRRIAYQNIDKKVETKT